MARRHIMESTFRLNLLNPQHAKINEVIKGLKYRYGKKAGDKGVSKIGGRGQWLLK